MNCHGIFLKDIDLHSYLNVIIIMVINRFIGLKYSRQLISYKNINISLPVPIYLKLKERSKD